jgi:4-hydroxythreonine-4-phosphate dehydrogenase
LALTLGDPAGLGPEIVRAALSDERVRAAARLVVVGPRGHAPEGTTHVVFVEPDGVRALEPGVDLAWVDAGDAAPVPVGRASREGGAAALAALRAGAELAASGAVDALVTAPVCKEALHLAGERVEGQTELLCRWDGAADGEMLAVAGTLRVLLLSRHVPLAEALRRITTERVFAHLVLLERALSDLGVRRPRLALAGLNPHAGENGLLGTEERDVLAPAVERARASGLDVSDPQSPDTVFLRALRGDFDGVLALYHDQAFIPLKLAGDGRALTTIAGLSYLRVSPAHGTAFDIAGRGVASPENLIVAILAAAEWARARSARVARA